MKCNPCGLRFSAIDALLLGVAAVAVWALSRWAEPLAMLVVIVVLHFLLFCNVFRVRRDAELFWAGVFVFNVCVWASLGPPDWLLVLAVQSPVTVVLLAWSFVQPDYHGVLWSFAPRPRNIVNVNFTATKGATP